MVTDLKPSITVREVRIPIMGNDLKGTLALPTDMIGAVIFAHGSGSSRFSPRNRLVAEALNQAGMGTLLLDLLAEGEEDDRRKVFDTEVLAERLMAATEWMKREPGCGGVPLGYLGASTGAGAALVAAARLPQGISAVVSRGGRPDLARQYLTRVRAPVLLIVGGRDDLVLELNRQALGRLQGQRRLEVIPGATHLFPEPGKLEEVARLATDWFLRHFQPRARTEPDEMEGQGVVLEDEPGFIGAHARASCIEEKAHETERI